MKKFISKLKTTHFDVVMWPLFVFMGGVSILGIGIVIAIIYGVHLLIKKAKKDYKTEDKEDV